MKGLDFEFLSCPSEGPSRNFRASDALVLGEHGQFFLCYIFETADKAMGSQIALKMAQDAFMEQLSESQSTIEIDELVKLCAKKINSRIYAYAHQMGAGGRMSVAGLILAYAKGRLFALRSGEPLVYVLRGAAYAELFAADSSEGALPSIGANLDLKAGIASIELQEGDALLLGFQALEEKALKSAIKQVQSSTFDLSRLDKDKLFGLLLVQEPVVELEDLAEA